MHKQQLPFPTDLAVVTLSDPPSEGPATYFGEFLKNRNSVRTVIPVFTGMT
jgi:hypothetical protein